MHGFNRPTWHTRVTLGDHTSGRFCLNCGEVLTMHVGQLYCRTPEERGVAAAPAPAPTQLEAFRTWLAYYRAGGVPGIPPDGRTLPVDPRPMRADALKAMHEILVMAQNNPPDGHGDGSFTEAAWTTARDIVGGLKRLEAADTKLKALMDRWFAGDFPSRQITRAFLDGFLDGVDGVDDL